MPTSGGTVSIVDCRSGRRNKKLAIQRAVKLEHELATGGFQPPPPNMTVSQACMDYLSYLQTEGRAPRTLVKYRGILVIFAEFLQHHRAIHLAQFSALLFDRYRAMRKIDHHAKTMYTEGVVVKQFFKWCVSRKLLRENPIADFKLSKPPLVPKGGPSLQEINAILREAEGQLGVILAVLAFTGMRSGELQRLRKEDLDLAERWLHIVSRDGLETKTRRSRKVPIHPRLFQILHQHPRRAGQWLFTADRSRKFLKGDHWISTKKLNDKFVALLNRLGLPTGRDGGYTIHSLRHSFETITVNATIPQRVVDAWLGHSNDRSMAAIYYRLSDEESQKVIQMVPFGIGESTADVGEK